MIFILSNYIIIFNCQAPGPGPGPGLVLPWTYHGQVPFLVKTGPGVDTKIKQPTTPPQTFLKL